MTSEYSDTLISRARVALRICHKHAFEGVGSGMLVKSVSISRFVILNV